LAFRYAKTGSIERTSLFRSTVFGAAAGYLTFRAGRHIINDPSQPIMFGSRSYYWNADLQQPTEALPVQCVNKIDPQDPQFGRVYYPNDTRPTEIAYGCAEGDYCCGRLLVFILVMSVLGVICIEAFRWALNFLVNNSLLCVPSLDESNLAQMPYCCDASDYCAFYVLNETGAAKSVKKNLRCNKQIMFPNFLE
ncbi:CX module, partial [Teladorsagia circumcincta]